MIQCYRKYSDISILYTKMLQKLRTILALEVKRTFLTVKYTLNPYKIQKNIYKK